MVVLNGAVYEHCSFVRLTCDSARTYFTIHLIENTENLILNRSTRTLHTPQGVIGFTHCILDPAGPPFDDNMLIAKIQGEV